MYDKKNAIKYIRKFQIWVSIAWIYIFFPCSI